MNKVKLNDLVKDGNIVIPLYMLRLYKKYDLNLEEFVFLMYLYNKLYNGGFNPEKIASKKIEKHILSSIVNRLCIPLNNNAPIAWQQTYTNIKPIAKRAKVVKISTGEDILK